MLGCVGLLWACSSVAAAAPPKVGEIAPDFTAKDEQGATIKLKDLRGSPVVLYSYPKDDTPGCTTEAKQFSEEKERLQALGVVLLGISGQDAESHKAFKQKHAINYPLLVDPDRSIMKAYGMWGGMMASRTTVLIGPDGKIVQVWPKVTVENHDEEVIAAVEKLLAAQPKKPEAGKAR